MQYSLEHQDRKFWLMTVERQCLSDHMRQPNESANAHHRPFGLLTWDLPGTYSQYADT